MNIYKKSKRERVCRLTVRLLLSVFFFCLCFFSFSPLKTSCSGREFPILKEGCAGSYVTPVWKTSFRVKGWKKDSIRLYRLYGSVKKNGSNQQIKRGKTVRIPSPAELPPTGNSKATLRHLLKIALQPVGQTMYIWGGGWNEEDTGAGTEARTIGISPRWERFFHRQSASYDYHETLYQIHDGLDCSGYVGWVIYNIMETADGEPGYVMYARKMAANYADRGWGSFQSCDMVTDYRAGDIMSSDCSDCDHVWIVIGQCRDGSVLLVHASPPGVRLAGTPAADGKENSQAVRLASSCLKKYYPEWYRKYPNCLVSSIYLSHYGQMRWYLTESSVLSDPDGYCSMGPEAILSDLFR